MKINSFPTTVILSLLLMAITGGSPSSSQPSNVWGVIFRVETNLPDGQAGTLVLGTGGSKDGREPVEDIEAPAATTTKGAVIVIRHSQSEAGWESQTQEIQAYSQDMRKPLLPGETKIWNNIQLVSHTGGQEQIRITLSWELIDVPDYIRLTLRTSGKDIDLKTSNSTTFDHFAPVIDGIQRNNPQTLFFSLIAQHQAPGQIGLAIEPALTDKLGVKQRITFRAVKVNTDRPVLWQIDPPGVGSLSNTTGDTTTYTAPDTPTSNPVRIIASVESPLGEKIQAIAVIQRIVAIDIPLPFIQEINPRQGVAGTRVTIIGKNFSPTPLQNRVVFLQGSLEIPAYVLPFGNSEQLTVEVPNGLNAGFASIIVQKEGTASNAVPFEVLRPTETGPTIAGFDPPQGAPGNHIKLLGPPDANFNNFANIRVFFGGVEATDIDELTIVSKDQIIRKVPKGAQTGPLFIHFDNLYKVVTSRTFQVLQPPQIERVEGQSGVPEGRPGDLIAIYGRNFVIEKDPNGQPSESNKNFIRIFFTGLQNPVAPANVALESGSEKITVAVPEGAMTGPITLRVEYPGVLDGNNPILVGEVKTGTFVVLRPPTITALVPNPVGFGEVLTLKGTNFDPTDNLANTVIVPVERLGPDGISVISQNVEAPVISVSPTELQILVPVGAIDGGFLFLTNRAGTANSPEPLRIKQEIALIPPTAAVRLGASRGIPFVATLRGFSFPEQRLITWKILEGLGSLPRSSSRSGEIVAYFPPKVGQASPGQKITLIAESDSRQGRATITLLEPLKISSNLSKITAQAGDPPTRIQLTVNSEQGVKGQLVSSLPPTDAEGKSRLIGDGTLFLYTPPAPGLLPLDKDRVEEQILFTALEDPQAETATLVIPVEILRPQVQITLLGAFPTDTSVSFTWRVEPEASVRLLAGESASQLKEIFREDRLLRAGAFTWQGLKPGTRYVYQLIATRPNYKTAVEFREVRTLESLTIVPSYTETRVGSNQVIPFELVGTEASTVFWALVPGTGAGTLLRDPDNPRKVIYIPPTSPPPTDTVEVLASFTPPGGGETVERTATIKIFPKITVTIEPSVAFLAAGQTRTFVAKVQGLKEGEDPGVTWSLDDGQGNPVGPERGVINPNTGEYQTPRDFTGTAITARVIATSKADPKVRGTALIRVTPPIRVEISPKTAFVRVKGQISFSAKTFNVPPGQTSQVTWEVEGVQGGNPQVGTITPTGLYTAPADTPEQKLLTVKVTARSLADASKSDTAEVTVFPGIRVEVTPSTARIKAGEWVSLEAQVLNTLPDETKAVTWVLAGIGALENPSATGVIYRAPDTLTTTQTVLVKAVSLADPEAPPGVAQIVVQAPISVEVRPEAPQVRAGKPLRIIAAVIPPRPEEPLRWFVNDVEGGNEILGTISPSGLYLAPKKVPEGGTITIKAVLSSDPNIFGTAQIQILPLNLKVDPETLKAPAGKSFPLRAFDGDTGEGLNVHWSVQPPSGWGTVDPPEGTTTVYKAPLITNPVDLREQPLIQVVAQSLEDPKVVVRVPVVIVPALLAEISPANPSIPAGGQIQFTGKIEGTTNKNHLWDLDPKQGAGTIDPQTGLYQAPLIVPEGGLQAKVILIPEADPSQVAFTTVTVLPPDRLEVKPKQALIRAGKSASFVITASRPVEVTLTPSLGQWDPQSSTYTAPADIAQETPVTLRVSLKDKPDIFQEVSLTLLPALRLQLDNPNPVVIEDSVQSLKLLIQPQEAADVTWSVEGAPANGTVEPDSTGLQALYKAPATVLEPRTVTLKVTAVAKRDQALAETQARIQLIPRPPLKVTVIPDSAEVFLNGILELVAKVEGSANRAVSWKVEGAGAIGSIKEIGTDSEGNSKALYTAPSVLPEGGKVFIRALALADPRGLSEGRAIISVLEPRPLRFDPLPSAINVSFNTATILWGTVSDTGAGVQATGTLEYGETRDYGNKVELKEPKARQEVTLKNLKPGTIYHYRVTASAPGYLPLISGDLLFQTLKPQVQVTSGPSFQPTANSITATWSTDAPATGRVEYGTDPDKLTSKEEETGDLRRDHSVTLKNLNPETTYYLRITSAAPDRLEISIGPFPVRTLSQPTIPSLTYTDGPRVVKVTASTVEIFWRTSDKSRAVVEYGTTPQLGERFFDPMMQTEHRIKLEKLQPATTYYYRVVSSAEGYADTPSSTLTFTTLAQITIETKPLLISALFTLDGTSYDGTRLPLTMEFPLGSTHQINMPRLVPGITSQRFRFQGWVDDPQASDSREFTVQGNLRLTALYDTEYQVTLSTKPSLSEELLPKGGGWYPEGSKAQIEAQIQVTVQGRDFQFDHWQIEKEGTSLSQKDNPLTLTVQSPVKVTAVYTPVDREGPQVVEILLSPNPTAGAKTLNVSALVADLGRGGGNITGAELFLDKVGDPGTGIALVAEDGAFDSPVERVKTAQPLDISSFKAGETHPIYLRGRDSAGNWGEARSETLLVTGIIERPGRVSDLRAKAIDRTTVQLNWTAPGDRGNLGKAVAYDLRYSTQPITEANFNQALPVPNTPLPETAGTPQQVLVQNLTEDTDYYFALRTRGSTGLLSDLSNIAQVHTPGRPPRVIAVSPKDQEEKVPVDIPVIITFDKEMAPESLVVTAEPSPGPLTFQWSEGNKVVTVIHPPFRGDATRYTFRVESAQDKFGNALEAPFIWAFTTVPPRDTGLVETPWPMFRRDPQHTGRSSYLGPPEPKLLWSAEVPSLFSSPAIGIDRTIYVGSRGEGRAIVAVNPDGTVKWRYGNADWVRSSPAIAKATTPDGRREEVIYIGLPDGTLVALNADGSLRWQFATGGQLFSSPTVAQEGTLYVGSGNRVMAITPGGSKKWEYPTAGQVISSPALSPDEKVLYIGSDDGKLYALDAQRGNLLWAFQTLGGVRSSPTVGPDGVVIFASSTGQVFALEPDARLRWSFLLRGTTIISSPAIAEDGTVYIGASNGRLYAFTPDGKLKWPEGVTVGSDISGSPSIDREGTVYIGSTDGTLLALKPDGTVKWRYDVQARISSSPIIGADGTLIISSETHLLALGAPITPPPLLPGDVNSDGKVDIRDATLALRIAVGLLAPTSSQLQAGDVAPKPGVGPKAGQPYGDGRITTSDVVRILRRALNLEKDPWP